MGVKKEVGKIGADFFSGLRFGLGGFPNRLIPRLRPSRKKLKKSRLTFGEFYNVGF